MKISLIIILVFLFSCTSMDKKEINNQDKFSGVESITALNSKENVANIQDKTTLNEIRIIDNTFSSTPFNEDIDEKKINELIKTGFIKEILLSENTFDEELIDTAIVLTNANNTKIILWKIKNKSILSTVELYDNTIELAKDLGLGMTRDDFFKKFKVESIESDTVVITDEEELNEHSFYFEEGILKKIKFSFYKD